MPTFEVGFFLDIRQKVQYSTVSATLPLLKHALRYTDKRLLQTFRYHRYHSDIQRCLSANTVSRTGHCLAGLCGVIFGKQKIKMDVMHQRRVHDVGTGDIMVVS